MNVKLKKKVTWWRYFIIPKGQTPLVENMKPNLELFSSNNISLFIFFIATIWILKASHNEEGEEEKKERKRGRVQGRENKNFGKLDNSKSIFLSSISFFVFYYFRVRRRNIKAGDENAVQYSTKQYSTVQNITSHYNTVQYSNIQYHTVQESTVQHHTEQYPNAINHTSIGFKFQEFHGWWDTDGVCTFLHIIRREPGRS